MFHSRRHFPYHIDPLGLVKGGEPTDGLKKRYTSLVEAVVGMILRHGSSRGQVNLALDLFSSPSSSVNCTRAILPAGPCLPHQSGDPVIAEVRSKVAIREGIRQVTEVCQLQDQTRK